MTEQMHTPTDATLTATKWKIRVSGYGTFDFTGTEAEAEALRCHKARWEQATAHKWRADLSRESDKLTAQMASLWDAGKGVPTGLTRRRAKALTAERTASVPDDVAELVVAARIVAFEDQSPEALKRLDRASEAFSDRVAWDDEPHDALSADAETAS